MAPLRCREPAGQTKIRVAQVVTSVVLGGGGQVISAIARHLDRAAFEMDVFCIIEGGELVDYIQSQGFNVAVIPVRTRGSRPHYSLSAWLQLTSMLRRRKYDVVHTHLYHADLVGGVSARIAGCRVVVKTLHNMGTRRTSFQHAIEVMVLNRIARKIICVSRSQANHLLKHGGMDPSKLVTIHNGVDASRFRAPRDKAASAISVGLDPSKPVVGTVGRLIEEKGHEYLLQAVPLIARRVPGVQFLIVGDGPLRHDLERRILQLRDTRVVITGLRSDVPELLGLMDLFVFPSLSEAFGIAVIEAMAAGVPVACADIPALNETVRRGVTGEIFPGQDPEALAASVCTLLENADLRRSLAERAQNWVRESFTESAMVRAYERVYREQVCRTTRYP